MGFFSSKKVGNKSEQDATRRSWPRTLYEEIRDMAAASFLVYVFGILLETARRHPDTFRGVEVQKSSGRIFRRSRTRNLPRTFTPEDVIHIVQQNHQLLRKEFPSYFKNPENTLRSLELLRNRAELSGYKNGNPLRLVEYDDRHQKRNPVYAISVDKVNKRVTLTFRGTDNDLAFSTNWKANINVIKSTASLPEQLEGKLPMEGVNMHSGYYGYLFGKRSGSEKDLSKTKFEEVWDALRPVLRANRGYKLYITGHSMGGALAIICSFFFACDKRSGVVPKPVTCISFGSPRVGDIKFMRAVRILEKDRYLRYCRVVNDNDMVTTIPMIQYHHAGVQVRLFRSKNRPPVISYPKAGSLPNAVQSLVGNSLISNLNAGYDHSDYRERIETHRDSLWKKSLNDVYKDRALTGFS